MPLFRSAKPPKLSHFVRDNSQEKVVVFIHGITGDADKTWRNKESEAYWPTLLTEDPDFAEFDIYVVSYPSPYRYIIDDRRGCCAIAATI